MGNSNSFGFGARLKAARLASGLSGIELGRGAGENGKDASKQSISDWESERHYPKADQLRVICLRLNINVDDLIFGDIRDQVKVIQAESAIKALTAEQREDLLRRISAPPATDERVGTFIQAAPPHPLDSGFGELELSGAKYTPRRALKPLTPGKKAKTKEKKEQ